MSGTLIAVVGAATTVASVAVKLVGLPDQIRHNARRRSTEGLSRTFTALAAASYGLWTAYGLPLGDWPLILGQGCGLLLMGVVAWQTVRYRAGGDTTGCPQTAPGSTQATRTSDPRVIGSSDVNNPAETLSALREEIS